MSRRMTDKQKSMSFALGMLFGILSQLKLITQKTELRAIRVTDVPAIFWAGILWDKKWRSASRNTV